MEMLMLVGIWVLNFGISWFNARSVGRAWAVADLGGFFFKLLLWSGAIMAWCGFTWCFLLPLALLAGHQQWLPPEYVAATMKLGYLIIIGPVLASGIVITIHSIVEAVKRPGLVNVGTAAYNSYAMYHNVSSAIEVVPGFVKDIAGLFGGGSSKRRSSSSDSKGAAGLIVVLLVVVAALGSTMLTVWIIRSNISEYDREFQRSLIADQNSASKSSPKTRMV